jgi:hypothetical protein
MTDEPMDTEPPMDVQAALADLRLRIVEAIDRLGNDAAPERIAEAAMAEVESPELVRLAWRGFVTDHAREALVWRNPPPGEYQMSNKDLRAIADFQRRMARNAVRFAGASRPQPAAAPRRVVDQSGQ